MSEVEKITIEDIIKYVKDLCAIRDNTGKEEKSDIALNEVVLNLPILLSVFSALIPKYKSLTLEDKLFYLKKYITVFSTELKKKNIYIKYTTETNIIDKKTITKDLKNYESLDDFNNIIIFLTLFFNINIFIIETENTLFYSSNYFFNIFKYSIVLKKVTKENYNVLIFDNETIFNYYKNEEFKNFIETKKKEIKAIKQDSQLNYIFENFIIQDDNDIEHYEKSNSSIREINKTRVYKNSVKYQEENTNKSTEEKKQEDTETKEKETISTEKEVSTEKINQIMDITYTNEELKKMTLVQIKTIAKQNKLRLTNPETKKPYSKSELIDVVLKFING